MLLYFNGARGTIFVPPSNPMNPTPEESPRNLTSTMQDATNGALKAQADLAQALVDAINSIKGVPKPALDALEKFHAAGIQLRTTQEKVFNSYFDVLKKFDPTAKVVAMVGAALPVKAVQDLAQKAVKKQVDLIKAFGSAIGNIVGAKKPKGE